MRLKYAFIAKHQSIYSVTRMCRVLRLHPSGYYAWKAQPQSQLAIDDQRLLGLLKQAWLESGGVYGYRKLTLDMRDMGEQCSRHCVARLLRCAGIKAQRGYGKRPYARGGVPAVVAPNLLSQQFTVNAPNKVWVTDIIYISTHEGWLYLATVIDLFSLQVIGWATGSRIDTQLPWMPCIWLSGAEGRERLSSFIQTKAANLRARVAAVLSQSQLAAQHEQARQLS